jgi:cell wall-associated NlpC family hydrolase
MTFRSLFPCLVAALVLLSVSSVALAQRPETRARLAAQLSQGVQVEEPEPFVDHDAVALVTPADIRGARLPVSSASKFNFQNLILAAIDERLGARYRWGATGPSAYDCSGFVWSTYQSVGINFERSSARSLWARFTAPNEEEKFKFGTLVFFSNLAHVGIVADEHGFYHASRHHGVIYSPFNDYWLSRLDGFRKVPAPVVLGAAD